MWKAAQKESYWLLSGSHLCDDLREFGQDMVIALGAVGEKTGAAVLYTLGGVADRAAALIPQHVEGTIAKKTVEPFWVSALVAGEIFTCPVGKPAEITLLLHEMTS